MTSLTLSNSRRIAALEQENALLRKQIEVAAGQRDTQKREADRWRAIAETEMAGGHKLRVALRAAYGYVAATYMAAGKPGVMNEDIGIVEDALQIPGDKRAASL